MGFFSFLDDLEHKVEDAGSSTFHFLQGASQDVGAGVSSAVSQAENVAKSIPSTVSQDTGSFLNFLHQTGDNIANTPISLPGGKVSLSDFAHDPNAGAEAATTFLPAVKGAADVVGTIGSWLPGVGGAIGERKQETDQAINDIVNKAHDQLGINDKNLAVKVADTIPKIVGGVAAAETGGTAAKLATGLLTSGLGASSIGTLSSLADTSPGLARLVTEVVNPTDISLSKALFNPGDIGAAGKLATTAASAVGGGTGFSAALGAMEGKNIEKTAETVPQNILGDFVGQVGFDVAGKALGKVGDLVQQAKKDGVGQDVLDRLQSFHDNLKSTIQDQSGKAMIPDLPGGETNTVRDMNKETNLSNAATTRDAILGGQKEEARLTNPAQLDIAKNYSADVIPKDATPETTVTAYRAGEPGKAPAPGDFVSLSEAGANKYVTRTPGLEVSKAEVPLKDLVHSGGLGNEFVYAPQTAPTAQEAKGIVDAAAAKTETKLPTAKADEMISTTVENPKVTGGIINTSTNLTPEAKQSAQELMSAHQAAETSGNMVKTDFRDDFKGVKLSDFAKEFQDGSPKSGAAAKVEDFLNGLAEKEHAAGIDYSAKANYLPTAGLWKNSAAEVKRAFGDAAARDIGTSPAFAKESTIKDIQQGLAAGLKLKTESVPEILAKRAADSEKAIATQEWLQKEVAAGRIAKGYQQGLKEIGNTGYFAEPTYAKALNNYITPYTGVLRATANFSSSLKRIAFTGAGVPGTGFNPHGLNEFIDFVKSHPNIAGIPGSGKLQGIVQGLSYMANPNAALKNAERLYPLTQEAQKAGSKYTTGVSNTLGTEFASTKEPTNVVGEAIQKINNFRKALYETPLFQKVIPGMKANLLEARFNQLMAKGVPREEALRQAGDYAMNGLGEINYDQMFRNKEFQSAVASTIFAPTFNEAHIAEVAKNIPLAFTTQLKNPDFAVYRHAAASIATGLVSLDLLNQATSGHSIFENKPGKQLSLDIGGGNYVPIFGSFYSQTGGKILQSAEDLATKGDATVLSQTLRSRLSSPAQLAVQALTNTDRFGKAITTNKNDTLTNVGNIANQIIGGTTPPAVGTAVELARGSQTPAQALVRATGAPISVAGTTPNQTKARSGSRSPSRRTGRVSTGRRGRVRVSGRVRTGRVRTGRTKTRRIA